jgi:hypothetical protein
MPGPASQSAAAGLFHLEDNYEMRFTLIAVLAAAQIAAAAPALTYIQDTLYKADGTRFEGVAQIEWKSFLAADGSEVPQKNLSIKIVMGQLRVALVPTTNALRPVNYVVRFNSDGKTQFVETWAVPPSSVTLKLRDVRTQQPVAGEVTTGSGTIADISGLRSELDVRPAKGAAYRAARTAVINTSGALDGALGNPADCVRVDGTSGPCGASALTFVDSDVPAGPKDGVNRVFTLAGTPATAGSLHVFRNGMLLKQGAGYTLSGAVITMDPIETPQPSDTLEAWYRLPSAGTDTIQFAESETPGGAVDGTNGVFTLEVAPLPPASLQVYRNGLLQKAGLDFSLSGNTVTFLPVAIPQPGDVIQASYRR